MRFFFFLLANALLFIRPSEFIAELNAVEIYRYLILACLAISFPVVVQQFSVRFAGVPPIMACVVAMLPSAFLSGLFHGNFELIEETSKEFAKILIYFLLMLALVTDTSRLRRFLHAIAMCSAAVTLIAILRYHADIALPAPPPEVNIGNKSKDHGTHVVEHVRDDQTGQMTAVNRMCGTGIFNDPNDLALVLVTGIPMGLYWLTDPGKKAMRPLWMGLLFLFGYALMLTHSRGGFVALTAGLMTLFNFRFGSKKTIMIGMIFLPVLFAVFAGRMTSISANEGTGQARIQLWSDALQYFQYSPLFGIGMDNYRQFSNHVAHNSFIHAYTELGVIGGTLFLGSFYLAVKGLYELRQKPGLADEHDELDPELRRLHPYLMAMLVAYVIGICFLSRTYIVPTYMMLGLTVVYMRLHATQTREPITIWNRFVWPRLAGVSCSFLIGSHAFVRLFVHW